MTDKEELRRLAQAATPGPWDFSDSAEAVSCEQRYVGGFIPIANVELGWNEPLDSEQRANGEFIAAANPATVIELLDEIERLRAEVERLRAICVKAKDMLLYSDTMYYLDVAGILEDATLGGE